MKQNYVFLWCFFIFIIKLSNAQIVNEGILQVNPSSKIYFGQEYTNKNTAVHYNNGDLFLNSDLINDGILTSNSGTTSFISSNNTIQTISGISKIIDFYNLEVNLSSEGKKGVLVEDNFGLYVVNGVNLLSGDLRLVGDSQLIQTHEGVSLNLCVQGKLHKDQQGFNSAYGYNHWSSPVNTVGVFRLNGGLFDGTDVNINVFSSQQVLFNSGSPYNGLPSIVDGSGNVLTPLTINENWLYKFSRGGSGSYADWIKIDKNSGLLPGEGFIMKGTNTTASKQNYVFKGEPNDGFYSFSVGVGESNLFGNPYPSAVDINKFILDNLTVFDGTLYFWVEGNSPSHYSSEYLGGYATRNLTTGVSASINPSAAGVGEANVLAPTQYLAVGQGFFIDTNASGNIVFNNSQRVFKTESTGESIYFKSAKKKTSIENSIVRIIYKDPEGFERELALGFLPESTADKNFNPGYDALMSGEREDELFFIIENNLSKKYVIQGVGAFNETDEFPLGLKMTEIGTHSISLKGVENFSNPVYIKDNLLNTTHNLNDGSFYINIPPGIYLDRFSLVFSSLSALDTIADLEKINFQVFYNKNYKLIIRNNNSAQINNVVIFNSLGQKIFQMNEVQKELKEISIPFNQPKGIYYVKLQSDLGTNSFKLLN
jgi:hypothetical protein